VIAIWLALLLSTGGSGARIVDETLQPPDTLSGAKVFRYEADETARRAQREVRRRDKTGDAERSIRPPRM
jgi:hypothetical protein